MVRIGWSADGNSHDLDELYASPLAIALVGKFGDVSQLVYFDYDNHLGKSGNQANRRKNNVEAAADLFGERQHAIVRRVMPRKNVP